MFFKIFIIYRDSVFKFFDITIIIIVLNKKISKSDFKILFSNKKREKISSFGVVLMLFSCKDLDLFDFKSSWSTK